MDIPVAVTPAVEVFKEMEMLVLEGSATRQALTSPSPSPTTSTLSLNEMAKPGVDGVNGYRASICHGNGCHGNDGHGNDGHFGAEEVRQG